MSIEEITEHVKSKKCIYGRSKWWKDLLEENRITSKPNTDDTVYYYRYNNVYYWSWH